MMITKRKNLALNLLNQIIQNAEQKDELFKKQMIAIHKAERTVGESWEVFHLKQLKELLDSILKDG